jgi:DNA recombination protein RmuC
MASFAFLPPLLLGLVLGAAAVWLFLRNAAAHAEERARNQSAAELGAQVAGLQATLAACQHQLASAKEECVTANEKISRLLTEHATVTAQVDAARDQIARERTAFEESRRQLKVEFENLAATVLNNTSTALKQEFDAKQKLTGQVIEQKQLAIDALLQPIRESLGKLESQSQQLEVKREGAYADIRQQIESMQKAHVDLGKETRQLVSALRNPKVRGNWGEMQLRRCIDFAGMVSHCDFVEQDSTRTADENLLRPDVRVKLPNNRSVIIDAKTPLDAFLSAANCEDSAEGDIERKRLLQLHAAQLREHLKALDRKGYGREFAKDGSPDLVVCFLPSEVLLSSALEQDPALIEFSNTVVLATPTTLIALLKAIACGWQQLEVARNAEDIREAALSIYGKLTTATAKIESLGSSLKSAVNHYNGFLTTVQGKGGIFSVGRKLHELSIGKEELDILSAVEAVPEPLTHEAWAANNGKLALVAAEEQVLT